MNKKGNADLIAGIGILIVCLLMLGLVILIILSGLNHSKIVNNLCKSCGYNKATDVKYIFENFNAYDKIECDNKVILEVHYPKIINKWGDSKMNWDKPEVNC